MTLAAAFANGAKFWRTPMSSVLGWLATAVTAGSFLSRQAATLKRVQAAAACLWIIYGANIDAAPLIVANLIVAAMAFYSSLAEKSTWKEQWSARLSRQVGKGKMGHVSGNSHSSSSHTAMVVSMYPPRGVTERTSDQVMFRGGACDRVRPENIDF
jgi:hypothetical protein